MKTDFRHLSFGCHGKNDNILSNSNYVDRGGELLGVLRVREHPLVAKSTLSKLMKNFIKHFVMLRSSKNVMFEVRIRLIILDEES